MSNLWTCDSSSTVMPALAEQLRGNAPPRHERTREASVVHRPASARRAFRFEHGHPAISIAQLLQAAACAKMEGLRNVAAIRIHHAHRTGPRDDLARRVRHGKTSCNFRAYGNKLIATAKPHHGIDRLRGPIVAARPAQQAGAHGNGRRCVRGFLHTGIIARAIQLFLPICYLESIKKLRGPDRRCARVSHRRGERSNSPDAYVVERRYHESCNPQRNRRRPDEHPQRTLGHTPWFTLVTIEDGAGHRSRVGQKRRS